MIANIHNENFGYSVAVSENWMAAGNPDVLRYDELTSSLKRTGSVEVYKYNINTDTHDKKVVLYRPLTSAELGFITTETDNIAPTGPSYILHTESTGSVPFSADSDILLDVGLYYTASEDSYGHSIDINNNLLVVGNPYFLSSITTQTASFSYSGSGSVDIFDLTKLDVDPYRIRQQPEIVGYITGSTISINVSVPASQSFGYVVLESNESSSTYKKTNIVSVTNSGGNVIIPTNYGTTGSLQFRVTGIVTTEPYLVSIDNPHPTVSSSFGYKVSINDNWIAISSPYESGSKGAVFMYQRVGNNDASWSLFQTISPPTDINVGDCFGYSIDLNKHTGSFSGSIVIGSLKPSSSKAYVYELISGSWSNTFTLSPDNSVSPLTFYPTLPFHESGSIPNTQDNFGHSVAIYKNTIVVGSPTDRFFNEYTGSSLYRQGSVYFFERCENRNLGYYLVKKSYGNEKTMKNNFLGNSVSIHGEYAVVGCPKIVLDTQNWNPLTSICYLRGTLYQKHFCGDADEQLNGQFILFNKSTASVDWDIKNVYQVKKRMLQPHRTYGYSVDIGNKFVAIGAPMLISGSNRIMDFSPTASFTGSVSDVGDLNGKSYIYNLNNLRENFYVGNVFYRNGKIVIMSSGSAFDGILLNDVNEDESEYDINFKSKQVVFEKQIVCPVEPGEFNVSTNPTALTFTSSPYDINKNGKFDFQDVDTILRYMKYKSTEPSGYPSTDWSSSILNTSTDEECSVYNMYASSWERTDTLFSQSYSGINNTLFNELDFNEDNKIDNNDMNILWKYFTHRLTQKNYETYVTPNSEKKYLGEIIDYLNERTLRNSKPLIKPDFLDYASSIKSDPTGSYMTPYVTSIGLYNGTNLVAIAKLGTPIKITPDFPINFVVKMDF